MRYKYYLSATGSQSEIHALAEYLNVTGSKVEQLRSAHLSNNLAGSDKWIWRSPYYDCKGDFPEDELLEFLRKNADLVEKLKERPEGIQDMVAVLVGKIGDGDEPNGYSISNDLITYLAEIRASLEIDVVR